MNNLKVSIVSAGTNDPSLNNGVITEVQLQISMENVLLIETGSVIEILLKEKRLKGRLIEITPAPGTFGGYKFVRFLN